MATYRPARPGRAGVRWDMAIADRPTKPTVFVSYAEADREWAEGFLIDALKAAGIEVLTEDSFALGVPRLQELERAITTCDRTVLVLSAAFMADELTEFADQLVTAFGAETGTWPVVAVTLHPVHLPPHLAMIQIDATDPAQHLAIEGRLCRDLATQAPPDRARPACPYPGMVPFTTEDHDRFFGRTAEIEEVMLRLRAARWVTVIGPSGSGKSSLVFAGVIPSLSHTGRFGAGSWLVRTMRPGHDPMAALTTAVGVTAG